MKLFAPALAFVDLETTGTTAEHDRITEVAIVRVEADPGGIAPPKVSEWSTLVDPGVPIPVGIQRLTGITDAMVRSAPSFSAVAGEIEARTDGALFIAHNARFDYGFLKHSYARIERSFSARVLCTVRLSRRLFPEAPRHNLDSIIARHGLQVASRHRALGDARALWDFIQALYRDLPAGQIEAAVQRLLKTPSLPPQLDPDAIAQLPEAPGVYLFYGLNPLPLYVGKSNNLRDRVASHFSSDYRSATDLRLSAEITRIEIERTAGELGALLRESLLVKRLMPAHNIALRRKAESAVLDLGDGSGPPRLVAVVDANPRELCGCYGPWVSRRVALEALRGLAAEHRLCLSILGLEKRTGACFARQLGRCEGACAGIESRADHHARVKAALAPHVIPPWPYTGLATIRERAPDGERTDVHVIDRWCWLGTARDDEELGRLVEEPPRPEFDPDIARLLIRSFRRGELDLRPVR